MEYIYVTTGKQRTSSAIDYEAVIYKLVKNCLFSLIGGLNGPNLGLKSLGDYTYQLKKYTDGYLADITRYADSGGYSIIKGNVEPKDIDLFIDSYMSFFEYDQRHYDYIFSLDIPFSLKYSKLNTKEHIYEFNKKSMVKQLEVISRHNHLKQKVFFVWQFKMSSLYEIWRCLVDELNLNRIIKNRAIGGMVSLRKLTKIKFSPFTAITYRCLLDYLMEYDDDKCFKLHFLGINLREDRFHILFLEKLFKKYMPDCTIIFTYDSIAYVDQVWHTKDLSIFDFSDDNELSLYPGVGQLPSELINKVYQDSNVVEFINAEIDRRNSKQNLIDSSSFAPLNIYSNLKLDCFFEYIIDQYELIEVFYRSNSTTVIAATFRSIMKELSAKYPDVFVPNLIKNILENLEYTAIYHNWFIKTRNPQTLEYHIEKYIKCIGCNDILV